VVSIEKGEDLLIDERTKKANLGHRYWIANYTKNNFLNKQGANNEVAKNSGYKDAEANASDKGFRGSGNGSFRPRHH